MQLVGELALAKLLNQAALADSGNNKPLQQSKRTRKLSAFMPMRGRKDGRDDPDADTGEDIAPASLEQLLGQVLGALQGRQLAGYEQVDSSSNQNIQEQAEMPVMMQAKPRRAFHPMRGKRSD